MVRFIPFEQNNPDEDKSKAEIIQQVHALSAIREMLIAYGIGYLPPENVDFDDDDKLDEDNHGAASLGLSHAIQGHIELSEDPAHSLMVILGHLFIKNGYDPEDFQEELSDAIDAIAAFTMPDEGEEES